MCAGMPKNSNVSKLAYAEWSNYSNDMCLPVSLTVPQNLIKRNRKIIHCKGLKKSSWRIDNGNKNKESYCTGQNKITIGYKELRESLENMIIEFN